MKKNIIKCILKEFINSILAYSLVFLAIPNVAFTQSDSLANQVSSNWEGQYAELDYMVSTSETPKREVQKQLTLSQYFAFAGLLAVPMCSNFSLWDINIWAAGSAYFMTHSIILRNKEKKIVDNIERIQRAKASAPETLNSETQKKHRDEQVESMEQILNAQREAIKIIKEKTNMLQVMVGIYSAAAIALGIMLIKPDGGLASAKCQNTKGQNMSKVEHLMLKIRELINKGFTTILPNVLPTVINGVIKKSTSGTNLINSQSKYSSYVAEIEKQNEIMALLSIKLNLVLRSLSKLIIESSYAQDSNNDPITQPIATRPLGVIDTQKNKIDLKPPQIDATNRGAKDKYLFDENSIENAKNDLNEYQLDTKNAKSALENAKKSKDANAISKAQEDYDKAKESEKTLKKRVEKSEESLGKKYIDGGENLLGKTLYFPYTRLGLYVAAGILTQISVDRNRKDIRVYEEKIAKFEKDLQDLKGATSKNLIEDAKEDDKNKNVNIATNAYQNNFGCLKTRGENYEYDATCECAKTNSCTSFSQQIPQDARPEYKSLVSDVDGLFNGKLNVNDQKTLDALTSRSLAAMNSIGNDVNLSRSANDKNAKPIDFKKDAVNMIKFASGKTMANLASNTSSSVLSGSKQSKNSVAEYSGFTFPSSGAENSKGQIDLNKENQDMDLDLGDIHAQAEDSVFDVISIRYKKTVLPRLGNNIISTR